MSDETNGAGAGAGAGMAFGPWGALAGAVLGAYMGHEQQKAQAAARRDQALINMYAPLFGQGPQALGMAKNYVTPGLVQGGMSGYQMGSQIELNDKLSKLAEKDTANPKTSTLTPIWTPYNDALQAASAPVQGYSYHGQQIDPQTFQNFYTMS